MTEEVLIAGFGGQGILIMGQVMAHAAMNEGLHATFFPSYGPEMRGGTANCTVVFSTDEIGSPIASAYDSLIVMNRPSLERFEPRLRPGGLLVLNTAIIPIDPQRSDIHVVRVAANDIAREIGDERAANMVMLGAFCAHRPVLSPDAVEVAVREAFAAKGEEVVELNLAALAAGRTRHQSAAPVQRT